MSDPDLIDAIRDRIELLQLREEAESEARHHAVWAIEALFVRAHDEARRRIRLALGALAVWHEIPEPSEPPELDEQQRATAYRLKRPRLSRFTYWFDEHINPDIEPYAAAAHAELSRQFETEFAAHPEAIFAYARQDARAFRAPWVVAQLERWDFLRDGDSIQRLIRAYTDARGKESLADVANMAARDRGLYAEYRDAIGRGFSKTSALAEAAGTSDRDHSDHVNARRVCDQYDNYRDVYLQALTERTDADFAAHLDQLVANLRNLSGN